MRCIICNLEKEKSKEHIIPEAMGNSKLITYKVCEKCNNLLGSKVDSYLTNYIVNKIIRKSLGLMGKDEKAIKIFPSTLIDAHGEKYLMEEDFPKKSAKVEIKNGILRIEAASLEEGLSIAEKRLKRMGKSEKEIEEMLGTYKLGKKQEEQPAFEIPADINKARYLLAGIKIAYEYTCELLGDEYLEDEIAKIFREELYKASIADKKSIEGCIDYNRIRQYASLPIEPTIELKNKIKPMLDLLQPKARHVIILHDSADHKMICEVFLCFMDFMSFTICVSEDAAKYLKSDTVHLCVVLEDEQLIKM